MKNISAPAVIAVEFTAAEAALIRAYIDANGAYDSEIGGREVMLLDAIFEAAGVEIGTRG